MRLIFTILLAALTTLVGTQRVTAQPALSIRIQSPANGATVQNPVQVRVDIAGATVAAAGTGDPQSVHYHILVDVDPATVIQPGQPLPTGRSEVIHTANINHTLENLSPGQHRITVILTRSDHVPLNPSVQDQVSFTVAAGQTTPTPTPTPTPTSTPTSTAATGTPAAQPPAGLPRTGTGNALNASLPWTVAAGFALMSIAVATAAVLTGRRRS